MIDFVKYHSDLEPLWNDFLGLARNSHFFFNRKYMDYHSDRFKDHSLLIYKGDELVGLFPANEAGETLYSHQGLSFGGLLMGHKFTAGMAISAIQGVKKYAGANGFKRIIYKAIPYIYHLLPSQEDLFALTMLEARLIRRDLTTTVLIENRLSFQERRRRSIKKAAQHNIEVLEEFDFAAFWILLEEVLSARHNTKPVHSLEEITLLRSRFPENIRLIAAKKNGAVVAGVVLFENITVSHAQYIASNNAGKELGALDAIFNYIIANCKKKYFDFGISTTDQGKELNYGLVEQKEGFGGRAIVQDFYQLDT